MRSAKKGFTLIELLIVVVIVGILALAAIPLITANTRDARRAEGEQMMGSLKNQARVAFAKLGVAPTTFTQPMTIAGGGCGVNVAELNGQYFQVPDAVASTGNLSSDDGTITATPTGTSGVASDGTGTLVFSWGGGDGTITWA